jgi:hypothetical protein
MRTTTAIVFFAIFFTLTGLISFYIFIRGLESIPAESSLRNAYAVLFWTVALSFAAVRLTERILPSVVRDCLLWMGSFWIAAMLYFLIAVVALDFLRLANRFLPLFPPVVVRNYPQAKYVTAGAVLAAVGVLLVAGHINSMMPRIRRLDLAIDKSVPKMKSLKIVAASDLHLGTIIGRSRLDEIVHKINSLDPDVVLLLGDIVDEDLSAVICHNLGEAFGSIRARYGVYGVTGNHEYIGGVDRACSYLREHGVVMLCDSVAKVADSFYLVGREDRSSERFAGLRRKGLGELMAEVDRRCPVILMDHQPFALNEAVGQQIDLELSGHTHDGQLWPVNYIVHSIYELAWGYKKIARTHFYVSDGVGTWGPPVRIGNRPEIVCIRLGFL